MRTESWYLSLGTRRGHLDSCGRPQYTRRTARRSAIADSRNFVAAAESVPKDDASVADLRAQIDELTAKLATYERLEEDLMAQRVFAKARKQLTTWITVGGLVAFAAGFVGFREVENYLHHLVTKKVNRVATADVKRTMISEERRQVSVLLDTQKTRLQAQINQVVGLIPIKAREAGVAPSGTGVSAPSRATALDYTAQMSPVRNQGSEGSVVGFAVAAALEYQIRKHDQRRVTISPRYLYYFAKKDAGVDPHADSGTTIRDAIAVLSNQGAVPESAWPYKAGDLQSDPPARTKTAPHYRIARSVPLKGSRDIKAALQQYGPVVVGLTLYSSFMSPQVAKTGIAPDPKPSESLIGGHAVCIVGYDDKAKRFKFKNSWGTGWGKGGYGFISYAYIEKYSSDAWAISL